MRYIALLLEDGVGLCTPPTRNTVLGIQSMLRCSSAPEAISCSADGTLLGIATRSELLLYVVSGGGQGDNQLRAHLRLRAPLHCPPKGLGVARTKGGVGVASAHGTCAVAGASGLTLCSTGVDEGGVASTSSHHGCALGAAAFSEDASLLALAAVDGRLFVHRCPPGGWGSTPSAPAWCVHSPCERVVSLDFSRCGRWLALAGWRSDAAIFDCAAYAPGAGEQRAACGGAAATAPAESNTAGADVAKSCESQWQEWRLTRVWPCEAGAREGPALLTWCRSPRDASALLCRTAAAEATDAKGGERGVIFLLHAHTGSCAGAVQLIECRGRPRGVCTGRVRLSSHTADNTEAEVLVWLDEAGTVGHTVLWPWSSAGAQETSAPRELCCTAHGTAHLLPSCGAEAPPRFRLSSAEPSGHGVTDALGGGATAQRSCSCVDLEIELPELSADALTSPLMPVGALVVLGVAHVALVLAAGAVQFCERRANAPWATWWAPCAAACFVRTHTLLLLHAPQPAVPPTAPIPTSHHATPDLVTAVALSIGGAPTAAASVSSTSLELPAHILAGSSASALLPEERAQYDGDQFVLVVARGHQLVAWPGVVSAGQAPTIDFAQALRVLAEPSVHSGDSALSHAHGFAVVNTGGLGKAIELILSPTAANA